MCQIIVAMYQFIPGSHPSTKLAPPATVIIFNLFDHLAVKGILNAVSNADEPVNVQIFAHQVKDYVSPMEVARGEIETKVGSYVGFVTPPGFRQWPRNLQQFAYAISVVAYNKGIEFAIVGANIRVDELSLQPCELSYPALIAEISKLLQAWTKRGSMQLTFDDATAFDYGMEMAKKTFDTRGNRKLREITEEERDAMKSDI